MTFAAGLNTFGLNRYGIHTFGLGQIEEKSGGSRRPLIRRTPESVLQQAIHEDDDILAVIAAFMRMIE